jgi:cell division control protein 6
MNVETMSSTFTEQTNIFADETVLYDNWVPEELPERSEELDMLHNALAPAARGAAPHNTFVYGKTGQGKSVATDHKMEDLKTFSEESDTLDLTVIKHSCAKDNTSYQVASHLVKNLNGSMPRGYDKTTVFDMLYSELQEIGGTVVVLLDEIDNIGSDDDILYELPRALSNDHLEDMWISVIGISNDFDFRDNLSPKVKDTLCDEEIHFAPYNANKLRSILRRRAKKAFTDDVLEEDVIPLCAAFAAQDKGSARQAIRYLYKAGELASNNRDKYVTEGHVRQAEEIIERKSIEKGIRDLTIQDHLALAAVVTLENAEKTPARTKQIYSVYKRIAQEVNADSIAMRRVRDHLQDLDLAGIVRARTKNTGIQGGSHYVFDLNVDLEMTIDVLREVDRIADAQEILLGECGHSGRSSVFS